MSNEEVQGTTEPVENQETPQTSKEYSDIEKRAMEMGWDPEHQGKTFVPAEEYVNRAPLFERIDRQSKEIRDLRTLVKQTLDLQSSVRKEAYERALKDLEQRKLEAVSTGDIDRYRAVEIESNSIRTRMDNDPVTKPSQPEIDPNIKEWVAKNSSWYNSESNENKKMKAAAEAIDTFLTNQARIDQETPAGQMPNINLKDHFKAVEKEVKRLFPHRFENMNREQPASVGKTTTGTSGNVVNTGLSSRLTPEQRAMGERFQKSNPKYTLDHYAADLEAMGRLNK